MTSSFTYHFTPSITASSSHDTSRFSLACNFDRLASAYPQFHRELEELKKRRKQHDNNRSHVAKEQTHESDEAKREGGEKRIASISTIALSSQVNHLFNAALTRALLHRHFELHMPSLPEVSHSVYCSSYRFAQILTILTILFREDYARLFQTDAIILLG
jgi:hypothetical protein